MAFVLSRRRLVLQGGLAGLGAWAAPALDVVLGGRRSARGTPFLDSAIR